jgi:hypothetical protein
MKAILARNARSHFLQAFAVALAVVFAVLPLNAAEKADAGGTDWERKARPHLDRL